MSILSNLKPGVMPNNTDILSLILRLFYKIDVDGIEHEILKGANLYLKNLKIKSLLIELNKDFKKQFNLARKLLAKNNFKLKYQINSSSNSIKKDKFSNTFNFIFKR
jgi:hypothetical protein